MSKVTIFILAAVFFFCTQATQGAYVNEVLSDNPLAYYRFEETTGTVAIDSSGNGNDGTYVGDPTLAAASLNPLLGSTLTLDGVDDSVIVPTLGTYAQISIEMWVKWTGELSPEGFTSLYSDNSWGTALTHVVLDGNRWPTHVDAGIWPSGTGDTVSPDPLATEWCHLVASVNSDTNTVRLYLDGEQVAESTFSSVEARTLLGGRIGAWDAQGVLGFDVCRHFPGLIDEVAIYGESLSAERVAAHYDASTVPEPTTLLIWSVLGLIGVAWSFRR